jgi:hypothetical protein
VEVPTKVEIKRIRITPTLGDPFSIEWAGVPEVNGTPISMKFYGLQTTKHDASPYLSPDDDFIKTWMIDIKVTNRDSQKQSIGHDQIAIIDQFGFLYTGEYGKEFRMDLMPGESARLTIKIAMVSALSRPITLKYIPSGLEMDISAWA